jgi:hypothetical protein
MSRFGYFPAILVCCVLTVAAQPFQKNSSGNVLEGRVTDWATAEPITAVIVTAVDRHAHRYTTVTSTDGEYRLEHLPRERQLTVTCSLLGYTPDPQKTSVDLTGGSAKWDPRLIQTAGNQAYVSQTVARLLALHDDDAAAEARFVADNVTDENRQLIQTQLEQKFSNSATSNRAATLVATFRETTPTKFDPYSSTTASAHGNVYDGTSAKASTSSMGDSSATGTSTGTSSSSQTDKQRYEAK